VKPINQALKNDNMTTATNTDSTLNKIIKNGPSLEDYKLLDSICIDSPEILEKLKPSLAFLRTNKSIMGHIKNKPYGYAGDFEIIERIYTAKSSDEYKLWDDYSLQNSAAKAVVNRKKYFVHKIKSSCSDTNKSLLNLASGPARDILELYENLPRPEQLITMCIDMDEHAIAYAKEVTRKYNHHINFMQKNVLRFTTDDQFDIIWSAGLFDYFDDKTFLMRTVIRVENLWRL